MLKKILHKNILIFSLLIFFQSNELISENQSASEWVEGISNQALVILGNDSLTDLNKSLDIKRVSLFILGPYRRNLKPAESSQYFDAIKNFISNVYAKRLSSYPSGSIEITKTEDKGKRGIIVSSIITFNDRPNPISIDWWIIPSSTSLYKVFDIRISGIWMAQEQRSTFTSFLSRNNGNILNLIKKIESQKN
jgi:phospholipid transport system substrate-binding protein